MPAAVSALAGKVRLSYLSMRALGDFFPANATLAVGACVLSRMYVPDVRRGWAIPPDKPVASRRPGRPPHRPRGYARRAEGRDRACQLFSPPDSGRLHVRNKSHSARLENPLQFLGVLNGETIPSKTCTVVPDVLGNRLGRNLSLGGGCFAVKGIKSLFCRYLCGGDAYYRHLPLPKIDRSLPATHAPRVCMLFRLVLAVRYFRFLIWEVGGF